MQVTEKRSNKDRCWLVQVEHFPIGEFWSLGEPQGDFAWHVPSLYTRRRTREPKAGKGGGNGQGRKRRSGGRKRRSGEEKNPGEEPPSKIMPARAADTRPV